jgi:DNA-binding MarR family transcriptional regulator
MPQSTPRRSRGLRTDSGVPPIGDDVDLQGLPLTALVARLTHQVSRELADEYDRHGIAAQPLDASLFVLLAQGGARLTAIAQRFNTSKQSLQFVMNRLELAGYVERVADPHDKRAKQIRLTGAGHEVAAITGDALRGIERRWRSRAGSQWPMLRAMLADIASIHS